MRPFLISALILLTGLGAVSCAQKPPAATLQFALKEREDRLVQQGAARTAEDKQIAVLLAENAKIRSALSAFSPGDDGYQALAEALAENNASLSKLKAKAG